MTSELDIVPGDKVLEIGTGSGYQAAVLSYLTPHVYSVEIIPPLAEATDGIYTRLTQAKYVEYGRISPEDLRRPISAGRNMRPSTRSS